MADIPVELTPAEWRVIKAVWASQPCTAPAVQEQLHRATKWSYSTVRTIMDRMVAKQLLTAEKSGKHTLFRACITANQAQRSELMQTLKKAFDGALTPMMQCLLDSRNLSLEELAEVESMVKAKRKAAKGTP